MASTPAPANGASSSSAPAAGGLPAPPSNADEMPEYNETVLNYLKKRGYTQAYNALAAELHKDGFAPPPPTTAPERSTSPPTDGDGEPMPTPSRPSSSAPTPSTAPGNTVTLAELASKNAPHAPRAAKPDGGVAPAGGKDQAVLAHLVGVAATQGAGGAAAEEALLSDPAERPRGYRDLERWVEGSLDVYRPELRPLLFPLFVHAYLDLTSLSFTSAARALLLRHSGPLLPAHGETIARLAGITLPSHVRTDPLAQRWRSQKYVVRMGRAAWGLFLGWLSDALVGGPAGEGGGVRGGVEGKGRQAMLKLVNERLKVDVLDASIRLTPSLLEESTGLVSDLVTSYPTLRGARPITAASPSAFNAAAGPLKLGPAPLEEGLRAEVERTVKAEDPGPGERMDVDGEQQPQLKKEGEDAGAAAAAAAEKKEEENKPEKGGVEAPTRADMPPLPVFRTADVKREVEKVRDARKRIRLGVLEGEKGKGRVMESALGAGALGGAGAKTRVSLPSVCAFTFHDAGDSLNTATFSPDSTLLAGGFSDSSIRLYSLRGTPFRGLRSDFPSTHPPSSLKKLRSPTSTPSPQLRLIAHSAPIYSLSFDPSAGAASPPRHLLSASGDGTARLWSLETLSNLAVYRGHRDPVWDVEWGPLGVYFATASRDRTARLWSAERAGALRCFAGHLGDVDCLKFHPNSLYLATGSSDRTARLWDVQRGACVRVFIGHQGALSALAVSPDGRYLASAADDLSINLWDLGSGRRVKKMTGHSGAIYSLSFDAGSDMLVSGGADWSVRCWDVKSAGSEAAEGSASEDLLATFMTKRTPIVDVQFTGRNLCMVAGAYEKEEPGL